MSEKLTPQEKEKKFGPVYEFLVAARKAFAELTKTEKTNSSDAAEIAKLREAAEAAKQAAISAQSGYGVVDIIMLLDYSGGAIFTDALTPVEGKRLPKWDAQSSRWHVKALINVLDDRTLPRDDKDRVAKYPAYKSRRMNALNAFIDSAEETDYIPQFGMGPRSIQDVLGRLNKSVSAKKVSTDRLQKQEALRLNALASQLRSAVIAMGRKDWLKPRTVNPQTGPTLGQAFPEDSAEALKAAVAPAPEATQSKTGEPRRGSGKRRSR